MRNLWPLTWVVLKDWKGHNLTKLVPINEQRDGEYFERHNILNRVVRSKLAKTAKCRFRKPRFVHEHIAWEVTWTMYLVFAAVDGDGRFAGSCDGAGCRISSRSRCVHWLLQTFNQQTGCLFAWILCWCWVFSAVARCRPPSNTMKKFGFRIVHVFLRTDPFPKLDTHTPLLKIWTIGRNCECGWKICEAADRMKKKARNISFRQKMTWNSNHRGNWKLINAFLSSCSQGTERRGSCRSLPVVSSTSPWWRSCLIYSRKPIQGQSRSAVNVTFTFTGRVQSEQRDLCVWVKECFGDGGGSSGGKTHFKEPSKLFFPSPLCPWCCGVWMVRQNCDYLEAQVRHVHGFSAACWPGN